jgi:AcrR family transcriptional regulator
MLRRNVIMAMVRDWIPTPGSAKGRLVLAALDAFGRDGYAAVSVGRLAREARTTTGPLYHHFESKLGLYGFVRAEAERRLLDRMEGAAAARAAEGPVAAMRSALLVGFDFATSQRFARILGEPTPRTTWTRLRNCWRRSARAAAHPSRECSPRAWREALIAVATGVPAAQAGPRRSRRADRRRRDPESDGLNAASHRLGVGVRGRELLRRRDFLDHVDEVAGRIAPDEVALAEGLVAERKQRIVRS